MSQYTPSTGEVRRRYAYARSAGNKNQRAVAEFDRWLAAHDAEVRAGVVAEEPEWEYLIRRPNGSEFVSSYSDVGPGSRVVSKRRKSPWVPVEQGGGPS